VSAERDTAGAGNVHWLETRFNELLANHERECVARITALEAAVKDAGDQVMNLMKENEAVRADLSQALAERDQEGENAARIAEELIDTRAALEDVASELRSTLAKVDALIPGGQ
jgi:chromosome segregation ATPase